jgi:Ser/Thr protein kinase RdoA (MazF antagonist)
VNEMFRARTPAGSLVVKRLGRPGSAEWLAYQADVLDALLESGFPVRPWLRSRDGAGTVCVQDDQWQVAPYVASRPFIPGDPTDVAQAAGCLDRLHQLSDLLPAQLIATSPASPIQDAEPWLRATEADIADLERTLAEIGPADADPRTHIDTYRRVWERARQELAADAYDALPQRLTHGEYVSSNVLYGVRDAGAAGGLITVIDWDAVQVRPRICDVARGALFFARRARGGIEVFPDLVPAFIEAATVSAPLSDAETAALIPFLELYFLPSVGYLRMLADHDPTMLAWYVGWSSAGAARVRELLTPILGVPA